MLYAVLSVAWMLAAEAWSAVTVRESAAVWVAADTDCGTIAVKPTVTVPLRFAVDVTLHPWTQYPPPGDVPYSARAAPHT